MTSWATSRLPFLRSSRRDALTGLPSSSAFAAALLASSPGSLHVIHVDLDHFSTVNEVWGRSEGDALLKAVAHRLSAALPDLLLSRLAADEFALLAPSSLDPSHLAAALLALLTTPFDLSEEELHVTASLGVVTSDDSSPEETLHRASMATSYAKIAGGSRFVLFDEAQHLPLRESAYPSEIPAPRSALPGPVTNA